MRASTGEGQTHRRRSFVNFYFMDVSELAEQLRLTSALKEYGTYKEDLLKVKDEGDGCRERERKRERKKRESKETLDFWRDTTMMSYIFQPNVML